jgi:transcriptional regulator GlxA family with amidase domain
MNFDCIEQTLLNETNLLQWIQRQFANGSDVAAMCLGTFILAATGLLEGRKATTHWLGAPMFRQRYPNITLEDDKIIIDEGRIYTSGAAYSFTSLMIYLIEKFAGRDIALAVAKVFMIQVHDTSQHAFSIFNLQHNHGDEIIFSIQKYIEQHYHDKLNIEFLADRCNLSQRTFIRRFISVTGNKPLEYIQRVRVEAAKRLLEKARHSVEEIANHTGYEDFHSFRNIFKRFTGLTPKTINTGMDKCFKMPLYDDV